MDAFYASLMDAHSWMPVALACAIALVVVFVARRLLIGLAERATRRLPMGSAIVRHIRPAHGVLLPALALHVVLHSADDQLPGIAIARHLTLLALIAGFTWLGVRAIGGVQNAIIAAHPAGMADNLAARRIHTQTRVLARIGMSLVALIGVAIALTTFPNVRQIGSSLLASAGLAGLVAGFAARPVLGNLIAGLQIGLTQPIRLDDVVIVEGEWGWIEEITGTYVVVKIWDQRRLVVPLQWWIEHPFQNWTRTTAELIGTVFMWVDYRMPLEPLREELRRACADNDKWDGRVALLQVTDAGERALQLRALVTARNSPDAWDLRCYVRERLVNFVQRDYPQYLPRLRGELDAAAPDRVQADRAPFAPPPDQPSTSEVTQAPPAPRG